MLRSQHVWAFSVQGWQVKSTNKAKKQVRRELANNQTTTNESHAPHMHHGKRKHKIKVVAQRAKREERLDVAGKNSELNM